ncbi:MAG: glycosyl hydrolase family protein, partial [Proteobacteria bacterium]|nr:glycosyl hydrolase family protein [Pseudomonadota bacterium]
MVKPRRSPLLMAIVACAPSLAQTPSFVENFNGPALDPAKWRIDLGPRKGAVNTERALSLRGGVLRITTFTENGVHHTGFIDTSGKFSQVTGRFEARLRFSPQPGMWSAFWSMSRTYGKSGDPDKADVDGVEIDIVEHLQAMGGSYDTTIHWGGYGAPNQRTVTQSNSPASPTNVGWHNYAAEWDKEGYRFYYDGDLVWTAPATVPNSRAPQHLIVSS